MTADSEVPTLDVVLGIVVRDGLVLLCRRHDDNPHLPGLWEFPGGKCEPGESLEACLRRELAEEVGLNVEPTGQLQTIEHRYPTRRVRLHPFLCRADDATPKPLGCAAVQWVQPEAVRQFPFPEANTPLLNELEALARAGRLADESRRSSG